MEILDRLIGKGIQMNEVVERAEAAVEEHPPACGHPLQRGTKPEEHGAPERVPVDYYASYAEEIVRLRGLVEKGDGPAWTNTDGHGGSGEGDGRKWAGELPALPEIPKPTDIIQWAIIAEEIVRLRGLVEKGDGPAWTNTDGHGGGEASSQVILDD